MGKWLLGIVVFIVYGFILLPNIVVVLGSFGEKFYLSFPPSGFTLKWYGIALRDRQAFDALLFSLGVAFWTAVLSSILGGLAALGLQRAKFFGSQFLSSMFLWPLAIPHLVLGVGLLLLFTSIRLEPSMFRLVLAHTVVSVPFVVRTALPALEQVSVTLQEAGRDLGSTRIGVFFRITLRIARTGFLAGAFLAFTHSLDELNLGLFLAPVQSPTLPTVLYQRVSFSLDPTVAALSSLIMAVIVLGMIVSTINWKKILKRK